MAAGSRCRRTGPCRGARASSASGALPPCRCRFSGVEAPWAGYRERAIPMANVTPETPSRGRDLVLGFLAGALAVVAFHQVMVCMLSTVGLIQSRVYAMRGVPPCGVPTILNQMFWGGLWGLLFAALADPLPPWPLLLLGFTFGVLGPVLASWFVVASLKGTPIAAGWVPQRMLAGLLINGFWGIGLALLYAGL